MLLQIAILGISLSLDAFGVGIVYGLRGVRIPIVPKLVICVFSILYSLIAVIAGKSLVGFFPEAAARLIGTAILIAMGTWIIVQTFIKRKSTSGKDENPVKSSETILKLVIKSLGITIQVIKNPAEGDLDRSGNIDTPEAILLGLALSVDAIGVGIGSALTGFHHMYIPFAIGLFQLFFLYAGTYIGSKFTKAEVSCEKAISIAPGILLILLALIRI